MMTEVIDLLLRRGRPVFFVLLLFSHCGDKGQSSIKKDFVADVPTRLQFQEVDSTLFVIPEEIPSELLFFHLLDSEIYCTSYQTPNEIYKLDSRSGRLSQVFSLSETPFYDKRVKSFALIENSFYVLLENTNILQIDRATNEYKVHKRADSDGLLTINIMQSPVLVSYDYQLYFPTYKLGYFEKESRLDESPIGFSFNTRNSSWSELPAHTGSVAELQETRFPYDLTLPYLSPFVRGIALSYPMDHDIYILDHASRNPKKINFEFKGADEFDPPLDISSYQEDDIYHRYRMKTGYYYSVNYHGTRDIWTRVYFPEKSIQEISGRLKVRSGDLIVIASDGDFRYLGEYKIKKQEGYTSLLVGSGYVAVITKNESKDELLVCRYWL